MNPNHCSISSFCATIFLFALLALPFQRGYAQDTTRLSLLFAGDVMGHDSQIAAAYDVKTKTYDYTACFQYIRPYLESTDLAIGNLEVTLAGPPYKGYPQFSSPDELAKALKDAGFDVLVTANNHSVDRGGKGIERTIQQLDRLNIPHTGTFVDDVSRLNDYPLILNRNGFTIALLNYTFSTNGIAVPAPYIVNRIDTASMKRDFRKAQQFNPDVVIAFMHWGVEYQSLPNAQQRMLTEFCFNNGAQLVIGAHPHVIQPMEWRKGENRIVAYSLGNFVSGQRKRYTNGGAMLRVELEKINYGDSATTVIDSASYLLQWVYRATKGKKSYHIIPVNAMGADTTLVNMDSLSKEAAQLFVKDSKALFDSHNVQVLSDNAHYTYPVRQYRIALKQSPVSALPGAEPFRDGKGNDLLLYGCYSNRVEAEKQCTSLLKNKGVKEAEVVVVEGGRIME